MQLAYSTDPRTRQIASRARVLAESLKDVYPKIDADVIDLAARFRKSRSDTSLEKKPRLSSEEYRKAVECIHESGDLAARLLIESLGPQGAAKVGQIINDHLEHYDGSGPNGKRGEEVLPEAYILNLSVAIQNMIEGVPNRNAAGSDSVLENVIELAGKQYPSRIVSKSFRPLEKMLEGKIGHLAEIGLAVSAINHDMGNYLTSLYAHLQLIDRSATKPSAVRGHCRDGLETLSRLQRFRDHMLAFAKGDESKTRGDVHSSIESALELLSSKLKRVDVAKEFGQMPAFFFHDTAITHVFLNLIKNAAEATKRCGRICIRTYSENNHAVISISDNGDGIDAQRLRDIFSGATTKKDGHGIGTQFCRYCVERHGGTIQYESEKGKGTTVTVRLPISEGN